MSPRLGLVLVPLFASATAFAQAPGEVGPEEPPAPPSASPVVTQNPCGGGGHIAVMQRRFAVGVNVGGMNLTANDDVSQTETKFRTAELSIRYRATRHLELELLLSGGRQVLEDGTDGQLAMGGGTLAARYRFRPGHAWNWWLMGGLGATVIERHDSTDDQRSTAQRGHFAYGIGLERRFDRFAIHAELRGLALGPREDQVMTQQVPPPSADPGRGAPLPPLQNSDLRTAGDLSGGQFTIGASLYF
jgi:opacity protein-like surface antigen